MRIDEGKNMRIGHPNMFKETFMRSWMRIGGGALLLGVLFAASTAQAAVTGSIEGTVTDQATGKRLAGVTVTCTSPALQGEQTEFTDSTGHYIITELPPGEYLVRFYFADKNVERPGVLLQADKTLAVNIAFPTQQATVKTYRITEKAPTVDVGNTQVQTQVTNELVRNTPVRGRSYDAVLTLAPGSAADPIGFSFSGSTGNENNFLIDGANTTNPAFGLLGTTLTLEFIGETEIITGGYNAEYGRATGGVVNVITKSGSNEFHGGLWFYATPFSLTPTLVARSGEAIGHQTRTKYGFDFGFDLGGPIVKDKIWFYVGFAPTFTTDQTDVVFRARQASMAPGMVAANSQYQGDIDSSVACPAYIDQAFCKNNFVAPGYTLNQLPDQYSRHYTQDTRLYNWIAKLNFQLNPNNSLVLQYIGSPQTNTGAIQPGIGAAPHFNGSDGQLLADKFNNVHDVLLHYVSKLADRRLQLDVIGAYHYEDQTYTPNAAVGGNTNQFEYNGTINLSDVRPELMGSPCDRGTAGGQPFFPCPVTNYYDGGWGYYQNTTVQRYTVSAAATYFARLGGTHALKLGFDFEDALYKDSRAYTGPTGQHLYVIVDPDGTTLTGHGYGTGSASGIATDPAIIVDSLTFNTSTLDYGAYLRDSYNVSFIPGLTVNAGVRWEAQQVKGNDGTTSIGIYDNIAPRVGAIYDFTRKGRGKIFASYGWFYENIPLDINDRSFSPEGDSVFKTSATLPTGTIACTPNMVGVYSQDNCMFTTPTNQQLLGGTVTKVMPRLRGQYSEEVVAGIQYDVGFDLVLGASYIHRDLGRIIEDMSPDGGRTYFIANPGDSVNSDAVADLQRQISATTDATKKAGLQKQLQLYEQLNVGFPKPVRNYDALVITATKRLSHNFLVLASYTYSRTLGNYPGLYQLSDNQTDPNISTQYDFRELLANRNGPLPNDRPHNLKLQGSYFIPFGNNRVVLGLGFNAYSGRPIEVLGSQYNYGPNEIFILPRGSGGRTPFVTQFDFHASYGRKLAKGFNFEAYWDIFNLFDQQAITQADDVYTYSVVAPIQNGTVGDLATLKTLGGSQPVINPNFGHGTTYQQPLSMRFGARVTF
jgi:hypothetical protein